MTMPPASLGNSGSGGLFYAEVKGYVVLLVPLIQLVAAGQESLTVGLNWSPVGQVCAGT